MIIEFVAIVSSINMDRVDALEREIEHLKKKINEKENELKELKKSFLPERSSQNNLNNINKSEDDVGNTLPKWAIERYSRQILLPEIGVRGQKRISSARVLVVGAGGLGSPAALYLAGAGVGHIGIVDYDEVEITNLHRQILHGEEDTSSSKVDSAVRALKRLNSRITVRPYHTQVHSKNIMGIVKDYDVVLDCTDNAPTRYLLNDACVLSETLLISGSALKMEGQLSVYNYRTKNLLKENDLHNVEENFKGPCYRCIFPTPPPPGASGSCSANGVLGSVPGVIGCLQALEAIKYVVGEGRDRLLVQRMLIFDGQDCTFKIFKLRARRPDCAVCADHPTITEPIDYEEFCNAKAIEKDLDLNVLPPSHRMTAQELASKMASAKKHLLVDVRNEEEFDMCHIPGSVNMPMHSASHHELMMMITDYDEVTFVCRRGNDSQLQAKKAIEELKKLKKEQLHVIIKDLKGGLHSWAKEVDTDFPIY